MAERPDGLTVRRLLEPGEQAAALDLRRRVFCEEQGVDPQAEVDGRDPDAIHLGAFEDGRLIGTLRLLAGRAAEEIHVQRVAVQLDRRRHGVGAALMCAAGALARERGAAQIVLHAQRTSEAFYVRLGYQAHGAPFLEEGIEHVAMERALH
ncbi:MAG TPA: GNAT family N-acetyltransferase [Solirubrobacteraceae bacterium]|jgi:predicted GNAT family N-acyltransferase|nr:GNAT family N-acetyltransferase [Solirubrobacteraceae bacterium]